MQPKDPSRRAFFRSSGSILSGTWLAYQLPAVLAISDLACKAQLAAAPLKALNNVEALELEAIAAQIFPSDETPGAREAGIIYFIDQAILNGMQKGEEEILRQGVLDLQLGVGDMYPTVGRFSALSNEQQIEYLRSIENTRFFNLMRNLTLTGMFVHPKYGGNRDKIGWKHLGFDDKYAWQPPFGYYDEQYVKEGGDAK
ncbi:MAG: hypothetical protein BMS9Abin05_1682 [Rhodothermia bacterium]|nr:MAG: hypothetical protein BMS9Abin05_1682 [Rhodothermia bacterium]